jgi:hypothetical protein
MLILMLILNFGRFFEHEDEDDDEDDSIPMNFQTCSQTMQWFKPLGLSVHT